MFCAFDGPPKIVRLHGRGTVITPDHARFDELASRFPDNAGTRAIIHIDVTRVSDFGYAVPYFDFRGDCDILDRWAETKGRPSPNTAPPKTNPASTASPHCSHSGPDAHDRLHPNRPTFVRNPVMSHTFIL